MKVERSECVPAQLSIEKSIVTLAIEGAGLTYYVLADFAIYITQ
jgi:hypothetical protein